MIKALSLTFLIIFSSLGLCQNTFKTGIKDEKSNQPLIGVNVYIPALKLGSVSDTNGTVVIKNIPNGKYEIVFSSVGYRTLKLNISFPLSAENNAQVVKMEQQNLELEQVTVTSTRTENRIENTPVRVEVLEQDEVNEEIGIKPGNISKLLGETSGIQVQQTSASSGNVAFLIQGLPGRYTQLLKDGYPLYSGFSLGLSLLQIPPLDLRQIEVVKGPSSALYGGDAIAGIINLVSKTPSQKPKLSFLLNQTQKGESDFGGYYSGRNNNIGLTFLADYNFQKPVDVNHDGFTDIPKFNQMNIESKVYFYFDNNKTLSTGVSYSFDNREGGDLIAIESKPDSIHSYINQSKTGRLTSTINFDKTFAGGDVLTIKNSINSFNRDLRIPGSHFSGDQLSTYSELSYLVKKKENRLALGMNMVTDRFNQTSFTNVQNLNYNHFTFGLFGLDNWNVSKEWVIQAGLRADYQNIYKDFFLPQVFFLYKFAKDFYLRFGGGLGYKTPSVFTDEAEEQAYKNVLPIPDYADAERSAGSSIDLNYHAFLWEELNFSFDQAFYFTRVSNPLMANNDSLANGILFYLNSSSPLQSIGFDSNIHFTLEDFEFFLDYTFTNAEIISPGGNTFLDLTPRNKLNITSTYEVEEDWRTGLEAFYTGSQYLSYGSQSPDYWSMGFMVEKYFDHISIVANVENLFDVRQTKFESIVIPPYNNPAFRQNYAPLDGRVANVEVKIDID